MIRAATHILALVFAYACWAEDMDHYEAVDAWLYEAFMPGNVKLVSGIRSLGELLEESEQPARSHDGLGGVVARTYVFENLRICALTNLLKDPDKAYISGVEITGPGWVLVNGIGVGTDTTSFRAQLEIKKGRRTSVLWDKQLSRCRRGRRKDLKDNDMPVC